jgi:hypothetical protein
MNIFAFLNDPQVKSSGLMPWETAPSIWVSLLALVEEEQTDSWEFSALTRGTASAMNTEQPLLVPGGADGALYYHENVDASPAFVQQMALLLQDIADNDSLEAKVCLYEHVRDSQVLVWVDDLLDLLESEEWFVSLSLKRFMRFMARRSPDPEPVKFALALLGVVGDSRDLPMLRAFGLHDEFTLYAGLGLCGLLDDAEWELFKLARRVKGWGRIHLVELLAETEEPEIQRWMFLEGFRNQIRPEYTALTCAVAGDLFGVLVQPRVSDEELNAAGELLQALLLAQAVPGFDFYQPGARALMRFLCLMEKRARRIEHFVQITACRTVLLTPLEETEDGRLQGWSVIRRSTCLKMAEAILSHPRWERVVMETMAQGTSRERILTLEVADHLGMSWLLNKVGSSPGLLGGDVLPLSVMERFWPREPEPPSDPRKRRNIRLLSPKS